MVLLFYTTSEVYTKFGTASPQPFGNQIIPNGQFSLHIDVITLSSSSTDTEISLILDFENKILQELGCLNKSEVAAKKLNFKFNNLVKSKCREHLGFDGYYTVYKIFYGKKAVESAISKLDAIDIDKALKVSMRTHIISTLDKKWQQKQPTGFGYNHAIPPKEVYRDNMLEIFDFIVPNRTNAQYALS